MPRLAPVLTRRAYRISPGAAALLPACRDLPSALNELRWIREHVRLHPRQGLSAEHQVRQLVRRRARGVPLQYVLGTQPFGNLELKCRPGVLIPRPEPEAYTTYLATLLKHGRLAGVASPGSSSSTLRILDLCTGTGCIPLLLYSYLHAAFGSLTIHGVDIAPDAVALARENVQHNIRTSRMPSPNGPSQSVTFHRRDIFSLNPIPGPISIIAEGGTPATLQQDNPSRTSYDILTCNPPYISPQGFNHSTARSVRNHEPKLAQVPDVGAGGGAVAAAAADYIGTVSAAEDVFYARVLDLAAGPVQPRVVLCEVGGPDQAVRVASLALRHVFCRGGGGGDDEVDVEVEIWADCPDARPGHGESSSVVVEGRTLPVRGSGQWRSVFIHRKETTN